ncbi:MAG: bifunctional glycosyltransferase family 2/GtrA family protein [Desulfobacterales bacterium]|nr:bifunctional glycosyltransferase family 2/GtrA family protein [Desulfobacterales bacterium]
MEKPVRLSIVIPCFNEGKTLQRCVERTLCIADKHLTLEIIIIDDGSTDQSLSVAGHLAIKYPQVSVIRHKINLGKGAALRSGFQKAAGDYVAVQDADLEYNPAELKKLLTPLLEDHADVVLGSRFLSPDPHRVLYFWHYAGNRFLTLVSNMMTDLNLTDMETCYKVFRRDVLERITIEENGFGFEAEIVAKVAHLRLRIYEMGISYYGRTYEEGKKIGFKDGLWTLYCIFRYNAPRAPLPVQLLIYFFIGGAAAAVNLTLFLWMSYGGWRVIPAAAGAFLAAAAANYLLCVLLLFRHRARWKSGAEVLCYILIVGIVGALDAATTHFFIESGISPWVSKLIASFLGFVWNFLGRRFFVFPEPPSGPWKPQVGK